VVPGAPPPKAEGAGDLKPQLWPYGLGSLIELEPGRTLLDLMALIREWGALLGRRADVTTPAALHPLLAGRILAEARPL
jgi:hypothetical protein